MQSNVMQYSLWKVFTSISLQMHCICGEAVKAMSLWTERLWSLPAATLVSEKRPLFSSHYVALRSVDFLRLAVSLLLTHMIECLKSWMTSLSFGSALNLWLKSRSEIIVLANFSDYNRMSRSDQRRERYQGYQNGEPFGWHKAIQIGFVFFCIC